MDYAMKTGTSLSTLRRHIKAKKIPFKIEEGRYLLLDRSVTPGSSRSVEELEQELLKAQKEIAELKTLIAFYDEERSSIPRLDV